MRLRTPARAGVPLPQSSRIAEMKTRIRVVFYADVIIAVYCLLMALVDATAALPFSLIPPVPILGVMVVAAVVLPCANLLLLWRARVNGAWIVLAHILLVVSQFLGIMTLIS
jgi:hypothetical protein